MLTGGWDALYIRDLERSLAMLLLKAREDFVALHVGILVIEFDQR
jgi:hypothetical protein